MPDLDAGGIRVFPEPTADPRRLAFRAVLRRTVEGDLLPRLLLQHRAGPVPPSLLTKVDAVDEGELNRFIELLRSPEELVADGYLGDRLEAGDTFVSIFQDLLAPAAHRLGRLWEDDRCHFVEVTVACARLQRAVRRLGTRFGGSCPTPSRGRALVCGVEGDQHTLGAVVAAETLAREGFLITLGPPFDRSGGPREVDVVAISVANADRWFAVRRLIATIRTRHPRARIAVGGDAVSRHPEAAGTVGADGWATDLEGLLDFVRVPVEA